MKKRLFGVLFIFALVLGMMAVMSIAAYAESDGEVWEQTVSVTESRTIDNGVLLKSDTTLTIAEGKTLTVNDSICSEEGKCTLTVEGPGSLIVNGKRGYTQNEGDVIEGNIIVNGGEVMIIGGKGSNGADDDDYDNELGTDGGHGVDGNVTVNRGSVTVFGGDGGKGGNSDIDSGARGGEGGNGIAGNLTVNSGYIEVTGGLGGDGGSGFFETEYAASGSPGKAVGGTLTGADSVTFEESDDGNSWSVVTSTLGKQFLKAKTCYPIWVGGTQVTSANADDVLKGTSNEGKVSFTPAEGENPATLTLDGADISTDQESAAMAYKSVAIDYQDGNNELIINAKNASTVTVPEAAEDKYGIYSAGNLTIKGDLTVNGGPNTGTGVFRFGVYSEKALNVYGALTVKDDKDAINYAVRASDINVHLNGTLTSKGGCGVASVDGMIKVIGTLEATASRTYAVDLVNGQIIVYEGAELIANGVEHGVYASNSNGSITINEGAKLIAIGGEGAIIGATVKNSIVGTCWENVEGTGEGTQIEKNAEGQTFGETVKNVQFPPRPADAVKYMIKALPDDPTTVEGIAAVKAARTAYDKLTDDQKDEIKASLLKKLTDAEKAIAAIDLADAKAAAKDSLAAYRSAKNNSAYDDAGRAVLDTIKADGDRAIDRAKDVDSVAEALADAKAAMDAVKTKSSNTDTTPVGSVHTVNGSMYVVTSASTASLSKAKSQKTFTLPAAVNIDGKTFSVTGIKAKAFKGAKEKTLIVKTKKLTKKSVQGSLKGSKVKTVKVKVGNKKTNKKFVKKYKKIFKKKNCGKKVRVK